MNEILVTRSDDHAWGAVVFAGTRVPIDALFQHLEAGDGLDEFLREYPAVTKEQAIGVLEMAKDRVAALVTAV